MSRQGAPIEGFCYRTDKSIAMTRAEWQTRIAREIAAGGFRRCEGGETYIHAKGAMIVAEIYGYIPAPKETP